MPGRDGLRPLKAWRYVGVFGPELMLCLATVRIGPARQSFWAVWDRAAGRLYERTTLGRGDVALRPGRAVIDARSLTLALRWEETAGVETICPTGASYGWTRKQGGIRARGTIAIDGGRPREIDARGVIDDTAAYYERHTRWRWCAGVGRARDGRELAWNLVAGVNDPVRDSERTVWVDGVAAEVGPVRFEPALTAVHALIPAAGSPAPALRFTGEAVRERAENLLLVRSRYRQPFGTFAGVLPGTGIELTGGLGVMEDHDVWW